MDIVGFTDRAFFAPAFRIKLKGQDTGRDVIADVLEMAFTDDLENIDSFEFVLNDWDPRELPDFPKVRPGRRLQGWPHHVAGIVAQCVFILCWVGYIPLWRLVFPVDHTGGSFEISFTMRNPTSCLFAGFVTVMMELYCPGFSFITRSRVVGSVFRNDDSGTVPRSPPLPEVSGSSE